MNEWVRPAAYKSAAKAVRQALLSNETLAQLPRVLVLGCKPANDLFQEAGITLDSIQADLSETPKLAVSCAKWEAPGEELDRPRALFVFWNADSGGDRDIADFREFATGLRKHLGDDFQGLLLIISGEIRGEELNIPGQSLVQALGDLRQEQLPTFLVLAESSAAGLNSPCDQFQFESAKGLREFCLGTELDISSGVHNEKLEFAGAINRFFAHELPNVLHQWLPLGKTIEENIAPFEYCLNWRDWSNKHAEQIAGALAMLRDNTSPQSFRTGFFLTWRSRSAAGSSSWFFMRPALDAALAGLEMPKPIPVDNGIKIFSAAIALLLLGVLAFIAYLDYASSPWADVQTLVRGELDPKQTLQGMLPAAEAKTAIFENSGKFVSIEIEVAEKGSAAWEFHTPQTLSGPTPQLESIEGDTLVFSPPALKSYLTLDQTSVAGKWSATKNDGYIQGNPATLPLRIVFKPPASKFLPPSAPEQLTREQWNQKQFEFRAALEANQNLEKKLENLVGEKSELQDWLDKALGYDVSKGDLGNNVLIFFSDDILVSEFQIAYELTKYHSRLGRPFSPHPPLRSDPVTILVKRPNRIRVYQQQFADSLSDPQVEVRRRDLEEYLRNGTNWLHSDQAVAGYFDKYFTHKSQYSLDDHFNLYAELLSLKHETSLSASSPGREKYLKFFDELLTARRDLSHVEQTLRQQAGVNYHSTYAYCYFLLDCLALFDLADRAHTRVYSEKDVLRRQQIDELQKELVEALKTGITQIEHAQLTAGEGAGGLRYLGGNTPQHDRSVSMLAFYVLWKLKTRASGGGSFGAEFDQESLNRIGEGLGNYIKRGPVGPAENSVNLWGLSYDGGGQPRKNLLPGYMAAVLATDATARLESEKELWINHYLGAEMIRWYQQVDYEDPYTWYHIMWCARVVEIASREFRTGNNPDPALSQAIDRLHLAVVNRLNSQTAPPSGRDNTFFKLAADTLLDVAVTGND